MQICLQLYSQAHYWDNKNFVTYQAQNITLPMIGAEKRHLSDEYERIYASGSIRGLEGRSMKKPLVNLSYWDMMLTTLKKKSLMKKKFSTYPKETGADQSSVRRLSLVDRRYVFSISVSLAAKEMNKSAAFCLLSPWGQT